MEKLRITVPVELEIPDGLSYHDLRQIWKDLQLADTFMSSDKGQFHIRTDKVRLVDLRVARMEASAEKILRDMEKNLEKMKRGEA